MDETYLTVAQIADLLKLNQQTIRNMIDRQELPAVRVGQRRVRVRQSDLNAFLAAGETIATDDADAVAAEHPNAELWAQLGSAMVESSAAIAQQDTAALADSLRAVAGSASALVDALDTDGSQLPEPE